MNPDENVIGDSAEYIGDTIPITHGGSDVAPIEGGVSHKWPDMLNVDLHTLSRSDALDQIHQSIDELIWRTVTSDGVIPDTYQLVIGGEVVPIRRVVAAQFFNLMFVDAGAKDRRKAISDFTSAIKRCYGGHFPPMIGSDLTQLTLDVDTANLTMDIVWEYTKHNDDNSLNIAVPQIQRFKKTAPVVNMGEMQRLIWLLSQATGREMRHDGILPVFTANIRPQDNKVTVAKLNVSTKD